MIEHQYGDIVIRRVANGWLAITDSEHQEDETQVFVYEDKENLGFSESLFNLLTDQFECYMQSKRSPGIKMSFSHNSIETEQSLESSQDVHHVRAYKHSKNQDNESAFRTT